MLASLQDLGNVFYFIAGIPLLISMYKSRKNMKGFNPYTFVLFIMGNFCFLPIALALGAHVAIALNLLTTTYQSIALLWILRRPTYLPVRLLNEKDSRE